MSATGIIRVEITATRGSAPRDAGTVMTVTATEADGTIGGGALELHAIQTARQLLGAEKANLCETLPLGPGLGQCCGGAVSLRYSATNRRMKVPVPFVVRPILPNRAHPLHLWVWGAGHVGREVVRYADRQAFKITWIDDHNDRFPPKTYVDRTDIKGLSPLTRLVAAEMPLLATRAPRNTHHLIFTYSHEIDLGLCAALLQRGVASIGLIGSATKWARFSKRLRAAGLDPSAITCPIGDKSLGKAPESIAQGTLSALLRHGTAATAANGKSGELAT